MTTNISATSFFNFQNISGVLYENQVPLIIAALVFIPTAIYTMQHLDDVLQRAIDSNSTMLTKMALAGGANRKILESNFQNAVKEQDLNRIKLLYKIDPNLKTIFYCSESYLGYWIDNNFDVNATTLSYGKKITIFEWVTCGKHTKAMKYFVNHGLDVNHKDGDGLTPLHYGAKFDHLDVVKQLVEKGANINIESGLGYQTPLCMALEKGHLEVAEYLIDKGARVQSKPVSETDWADSAIVSSDMHSIKEKTKEKTKENRKDLFSNDQTGEWKQKRCLDLISQGVISLKETLGICSSPIHLVVKLSPEKLEHQKRIITKLLQKGADINVVNDHIETPLSLILSPMVNDPSYQPSNEYQELIKFLLDKGAKAHELKQLEEVITKFLIKDESTETK